jgi:hypothetical protein
MELANLQGRAGDLIVFVDQVERNKAHYVSVRPRSAEMCEGGRLLVETELLSRVLSTCMAAANTPDAGLPFSGT